MLLNLEYLKQDDGVVVVKWGEEKLGMFAVVSMPPDIAREQGLNVPKDGVRLTLLQRSDDGVNWHTLGGIDDLRDCLATLATTLVDQVLNDEIIDANVPQEELH